MAPLGARTLRNARRPVSGSGKMVQHAGTDDLIECPAELPDLLDREPMEIEVSQVISLLKIARMAQAGLADVDCRYPSVRLAQRIDGSLRRSTAGDQDLSIWPLLLRRPQQQRHRPASIRVPIELAMPIEVAKRRRIRMAFVKSAYRGVSLSLPAAERAGVRGLCRVRTRSICRTPSTFSITSLFQMRITR